MKNFCKNLVTSFFVFVCFTLLLGVVYPYLMIGIGKLFFKNQANGSLIVKNNKIIGSYLIGENFTEKKYFHERFSSNNYNPLSSGSSNLPVTSKNYTSALKTRIAKVLADNPQTKNQLIPIDLITESGSGLDPNISVDGALFQASRIAKTRNISEKKVIDIINQHIITEQFGIFGRPYVNALELNLALDSLRR